MDSILIYSIYFSVVSKPHTGSMYYYGTSAYCVRYKFDLVAVIKRLHCLLF